MKKRFRKIHCPMFGLPLGLIAGLGFAVSAQADIIIGGGAGQVIGNGTPFSSAPIPWDVGGDLIVGDTGIGTLDITGGDSVVSVNGTIGNIFGSNGTVTVSGEVGGVHSSWTNSGNLTVGNYGTGTLEISGGGSVVSSTSTIGFGPAANGTVTVAGPGSTWTNSGDLYLGDGVGTLNIVDGGKVSAAYVIGAGALGGVRGNGTINLDSGGVLETGGVRQDAGKTALYFDGGILRATADNSDFLNLYDDNAVTIKDGGATIDSNGHAITSDYPLTGTGGLTKTGLGTLTLWGVNTYEGATTIDRGTLALAGNDGSIAASSGVWLATGGVFDISGTGGASIKTLNNTASGQTGAVTLGSRTLTVAGGGIFGGRIEGAGGLTVAGGTLTLAGDNTYTDLTTIASNATLFLGEGGATGSIGGNVVNDGYLYFDRANDLTFNGQITGSGNLWQVGSGATTLTAAGSGAGDVTVDSGTLVFAQTGAFTANSYTTRNNATTTIESGAQLNVTGQFTQQEFSNATLNLSVGSTPPITAGTALLSGTLNVSGLTSYDNQTYTLIHTTGGITSDFSSVNLLGLAPSTVDYLTATGFISSDALNYRVFAGLSWYAPASLAHGTFTLAGASDAFTVDTVLADRTDGPTFANGWDGKSLTKKGPGTLTLTAANTYTGATTIEAGTLALAGSGSIADSSGVWLATGGVFDIAGTDAGATIAGLNNTAAGQTGAVTLGSRTLTVAGGGSFGGTIEGTTGGLTKTGLGTLTLTGASSYGGNTTVNGGTLAITGGGSVTNNRGSIGNDAGSAGAVTVDGGTWTNSGSLYVGNSGSGTLDIKNGSVASGSSIIGNGSDGTVTVDGGTWTINGLLFYVGDGGDGTLNIKNGGSVSSGNSYIGTSSISGSHGTVTVDGGTWTSGLLSVGDTSNGTLTITNNGLVSASATQVGSVSSGQGTITLASGGVLETGSVTKGAGRATLNFDGGILRATADKAAFLSGFASGDITLQADGAIIDSNGFTVGADSSLGGSGGLTKIGIGTLTLSGNNTYTGNTTINAGKLALAGSGSIADSSGVWLATGSAFDIAGTDAGATIAGLNNTAPDQTGAVTLGSRTLTVAGGGSFGGVISGTGGSLTVSGGTLTLTGDNTYTGGTTINLGATLNIGSAADPTSSGSIQGTVSNSGTLDFYGLADAGGTAITNNSGSGSIADAGKTYFYNDSTAGSATITNFGVTYFRDNSSAGNATITNNNDGVTDFLNDSTAGSATITNNGNGKTYFWDTSDAGNAKLINADGSNGIFDFSVTTGPNHDGKVNAGSIAGGGTFKLGGNELTVGNNDSTTVSGEISGTGGRLVKIGIGTLTLSGDNTYTGNTTINAGTLKVDGSIAASNLTTVNNGGTLTGNGTVGATVVAGGGTLAGASAGASAGTLTLNALTLNSGSILDVTLGSTSAAELFHVNNTLALNGGTVNVNGGTGFGNGLYRLIGYGDLSGSVGNLGITTTTSTPLSDLALQNDGIGQSINLYVGHSTPGSYTFWDGGDTTGATPGVQGGTGTWSAGGHNWTNADGSANGPYDPTAQTPLIFQGLPGIVTVDAGGSALPIASAGLQFYVDGYRVEGDGLALGNSTTTIRVGDGTASSAAYTATIASAISGNGGIDKTDYGTLALAGINTYSGGTTISGGTLAISDNRNLGNVLDGVTLNGGTLEITGTTGFATSRDFSLTGKGGAIRVDNAIATYTVNGQITDAGVDAGHLAKVGNGTLVLTNTGNSYSGGTTINGGAVQISDDRQLGDAAGAVTLDNGTLYVTGNSGTSRNFTLGGATGVMNIGAGVNYQTSGSITGDSGNSLSKTGAGALTLTGTGNNYGATYVNEGTLVIATGGTLVNDVGSIGSGVSATTVTVSGDGSKWTVGQLDLSGGAATLNIVGGGAVSAGSLTAEGNSWIAIGGNAAGAPGSPGTLSVSGADGVQLLDSTAILAFNHNSGDYSFGTRITGSGIVFQAAGVTTLTNTSNSYSGGTRISGGTLRVADDRVLGAGSVALGSGGTLEVTATTTGSRNFEVNGSGGTILTDDGVNYGIGGAISGTSTSVLNKNGAGTLTLTGDSSTYGGATRINAGSLILDADAQLGGSVNVYGGGTFGGSGTATGSVGVDNGGTIMVGLSHGNATAPQTLAIDGNLFLTTGSTLQYDLYSNNRSDLLTVGGNLYGPSAGTITVLLNAPITGHYELISTGSGITGTASDFIAAFAGGAAISPRTSASFSIGGNGTGADNSLWLDISTSNLALTWTGATSLKWDNSGVANWTGSDTAFLPGDKVTFNDTAAVAKRTVTVADNVVASDMVVDTGGTYTFSGTGGITTSTTGTTLTNATGTLTKTGSGTLVLANGANDFQGGIDLNGGTLAVGSAEALGNATLGYAALRMADATTLDVRGNWTLGNAITLAGEATYNVGNGLNVTQSGAISGTAGSDLTKTGLGTLTLTGDSSAYGGATRINAGSLILDADATLGGNVFVYGGGTLGGVGTATDSVGVMSGGTIMAGLSHGNATAPETLTIGGNLVLNAGSTLKYDLYNGDRSDLLAVGGSLAVFAASVPVTVELNAPITGHYELISTGSGINGAASDFTAVLTSGAAFSPRTDASFSIGGNGTGADNSLWLDISTRNLALTWTGATNSAWDNSGVVNWKNDTPTSDAFLPGDSVTFNDTAAVAKRTVTVGDNVIAAGMTVDTSGTYTFTGADSITTDPAGSTITDPTIATGKLTKTGTGTLVLANTGANNFTGGIDLNGGTLAVGSAEALGNATLGYAALRMADATTLDVRGNWTLGNAITLAGAATYNVGSGLAVTQNGAIDGNGGLTKTGAGALTLAGNNSYLGGTTISLGTLSFGDETNLGASTGGVTLDGGTLEFTGNGVLQTDRNFSLTGRGGGIAVSNNSGYYLITGSISDSGTGTAGALTKTGAGALALSGTNTYTGGTTIHEGDLLIYAANSTDNLGTGAVRIDADGRLDVFNAAASAVSFNNKLTGTGILSAANDNNTFSFGPNVGSAFAGTVRLFSNRFLLSGDNTTALTSATLQVGTGNITTVGAGAQRIGGLAFNGGTLIFGSASAPDQTVAASRIVVGTLDASGTGTVQINVPDPYTPALPTPTGSASLFAQSHVSNGLQLVAANSVIGNAGNLVLQDLNGNTLGQNQTVNIAQNGNTVAKGSYNYMLGTGAANDGLYVGYGLTRLDLQANQTLTLTEDAGATGNNADMAAEITGTGNLEIAARNTITLSGANTYTGDTTISLGTLVVTGTLGNGDYGGNIANNGALIFNQGADQALSGQISGTGSLTKDGTGTLTLSGDNSYSGLTEVKGGTLALDGAGSLPLDARLALYGGATFVNGGTPVQLSTLDVRGSATWDGNLTMGTGQTLNFYVPATMGDGGTMLHVNGGADIAGSRVEVGINGASSPLRVGQHLVLIDANTLTGMSANTSSKGEGMLGLTLRYEFDLTVDGLTDNQLWATVTSVGASAQSESLSQGFLSGMGLLNQGSDLIAGWGMNAAVDAARQPNLDNRYGIGVFGAVNGGSTRYKTGSSMDVSGVSVMAGVSKGIQTQPGRLMVGAFIEYGNGSYDTYAAFHGDGDLDHVGGGIIGRFDFGGSKTGHFYTEGSARMGSIDNDFGGIDTLGRDGRYDASSTYYGIHLGSGYIWNLTDRAALDLYARYFWTQQKGDTVRLSTGETVDFDNINSHRMRLGTRFAYSVAENINPYVGLAYEHEFDGEARARTNGYALVAPSIDGGSAVGELGLTLKPTAAVPVTLDLGVQGYTGAREGVTGTLHLRYDF